MYTFFFAILFIAEVIITVQIIAFIIKCDRKVCELDNRVTEVKESLPEIFGPVKESISGALISIENIKKKLSEKKSRYKYAIIKHIITGLLFIILNTNGKKIITFIELIFAFRDFAETACKSFNSLKV